MIFQIYPTNESRQLEMYHCEPLFQWVFEYMLQVCEAHEADAATRLYVIPSRMPWAASFQCLRFEKKTLKYLDSIITNHSLPIHRLGQPNQMMWSYPGLIPCSTFKGPTLIRNIKDAIEDKGSLHLVPSAFNFLAVNLIIYHPDQGLTLLLPPVSSILKNGSMKNSL